MLFSQSNETFLSLYKSGAYQKSLKKIESKLKEIYDKRVENKQIPNKQLYIESIGEDKFKKDYQEIIKKFRVRKTKKYFLEDNKELANLHLYAGLCYKNLKNNRYALHHFNQTLKYKELEYKKDDIVFYNISQIFKEQSLFKGYVDALEMAYSLNEDNIEYSKELGEYLYLKGERRRAIYHLERYIEKSDKVEQRIFIKLAGLNEGEKNYLKTERYYLEYLMNDQNNANIHFAVGILALNHTGNLKLAEISFNKSIKLLPETDIYRKAKSYEYIGEIHYRYMKYDKSATAYEQTIQYHNKIEKSIDSKKNEIKSARNKITKIKASLILKQDPEKYSQYLKLRIENGDRESELKNLRLEFKKLNVGKVKWRIAYCYEKLDKLKEAIKFYKKSVLYHYKPSDSEKRILKLKLKLFRGY